MPAVVVGDQRDGRVADLGLTSQLRFLQVGHADDVHAPALVEARLGQRGELRPFHADVGPPHVHVRADRLGRLIGDAGQVGADRVCERHVRDQTVAEEGAGATLCAIEELIGHHHVQRRDLFLEAADRARREDPVDAEQLEAEDVGPIVQLRGHEAVTGAVPGEKGHAASAEHAGDVGPARIAERRRHAHFLALGELLHVVEPATPDDAYLNGHGPPLSYTAADANPGRGWSTRERPKAYHGDATRPVEAPAYSAAPARRSQPPRRRRRRCRSGLGALRPWRRRWAPSSQCPQPDDDRRGRPRRRAAIAPASPEEASRRHGLAFSTTSSSALKASMASRAWSRSLRGCDSPPRPMRPTASAESDCIMYIT